MWVVRNGVASVFAGTGEHGFAGDGGLAREALLRQPADIAVGNDGTVFIADSGNNRIRFVTSNGTIETLVGNLPPEADPANQPDSSALFRPEMIAITPDGSLYVVDDNRRRIQRVRTDRVVEAVHSPSSGRIAGLSVRPDGGLILLAGALWRLDEIGWNPVGYPQGQHFTAVEAMSDGILAFERTTNRIVKIGDDDRTAMVAGNGTRASFGDGGPADGASFACAALAIDADRNIYLSDPLNRRIAVIDRSGTINTLVGGPDVADLSQPRGIAVSGDGTLYVADAGRHQVYRMPVGGSLEPFAGTGEEGFAADGGKASDAQLADPRDVVVTATGDVLIVDSGNYRLRRVDSSGQISTFAALEAPTTKPQRVLPLSDGSFVVMTGAGPIGFRADGSQFEVVAPQGNEDQDVWSSVVLAATKSVGAIPSDAGALLIGPGAGLAELSGPSKISRAFPPAASATRAVFGAVDPEGDLIICDDVYRRIVRIPAPDSFASGWFGS